MASFLSGRHENAYRTLPVVLCLVILAFAGIGGGEVLAADSVSGKDPAKTLEDFQFVAEVERSEIHKKYDNQRKDLVEKYVGAIEKIAQSLQESGDLDSLLQVRQEIEYVRQNSRAADFEFPALDSAREILATELGSIEASENTDLRTLAEKELPTLEVIKVALTKAGLLDKALLAKAEIESRQSLLESKEPAASNIAPLSSAYPSLEVIKDGPMYDLETIEGSHQLKAGLYDLDGRKVTVGTPRKDGNLKVEGEVIAPANCVFQNGSIFVVQGNFTVEREVFSNVKLTCDLGGTISAEDCLFQDCTVEKEGGWTFKLFSAKLIFSNCVFAKSFLPEWNTHLLGVKLEDCTFHDVRFVPIEYREDASSESTDQWMTVKNCRFVNCEVPESVLIATDGCVFVNCTFPGPDVYPSSRPASASITTTTEPPAPLATSENSRIRVKTTTTLVSQGGSRLSYSYENGRLALDSR